MSLLLSNSERAAPLLERLTTRYSNTEDRICVAGELAGAQPMVLWLTQRLLLRLLPSLFEWLQAQEPVDVAPKAPAVPSMYADAVQSFAQEAARRQLQAQLPVTVPAQAPQLLVETVSLGRSSTRIHAVFAGASGISPVGMALGAQALRQWLDIVQRQWRIAQWPMEVWPQWMLDHREGESPAACRPMH